MAYMPDIKRAVVRRSVMTVLACGVTICSLTGAGWAQDVPLDAPRTLGTLGTVAPSATSGQPDDFSGWQSLPEVEMSHYSGGTEVSFGDVGVNLATNAASLVGNSVDGRVETGKIQDINLNDVGGINTMMFNTGNNVNFQSNMQINIFVK